MNRRIASYFLSFLFLLLAFHNTFGLSKNIEVPAIRDPEVLPIKLGTITSVDEPRFKFNKVYERSVSRLEQIDFRPCRQNRAEVQFKIIDQILLHGVPKRPNVYYNFEEIKYSQYLLDVYYQNQKIYIMFKNHRYAIVTLQNDQRISQTKMIIVEGIDKKEFLQVGYFIKLRSALLFVNKKYAIKVDEHSAKTIQGYVEVQLQQFQSAIHIEDDHFAVLQANYGVYLYEYDGTKLFKQYQFNETILSAGRQANLEDMAYWQQKKILFTLDKFWGVRAFIVEKTQTSLVLKETNLVTDMPYCTLMYLYQTSLYVYCGQIRVYDLSIWPNIAQHLAPYPNVKVRQIYRYGDITVYVGRNSFAMVYLGRLVNYFEDVNLDKLLLYKDFFISADQQGVDIGTINMIQPYITCQTNDQSYLGETPLVFKTKAECSKQYFDKYGIDQKLLDNLEPEDICVYTLFKTVKYWKAGEINVVPFVIGGVIIFLGILTIGVFYFMRKKKIQHYMAVIEQYSRQQVSQSAKYQNVVEDLDGGVNDKVRQSIKLQQQNPPNKETQQPKAQTEVQLTQSVNNDS